MCRSSRASTSPTLSSTAASVAAYRPREGGSDANFFTNRWGACSG
ncbi:hypothetical protein PZE19_26765 [Paludisphaera sp. Pla2]|uniref:Uncharacterized protein n=1 Tax=Paludisphaera mucosa TaxID=3030827 RepID=A0ABT6FIH4_9BACT|nr:hypothetical protein [Paludisphaera mucosa]MDG3007380.1 hypothetical protein [Paludisphaera mucosa]